MLKVLVAEDSVLIADMLEDILLAQGYDVCGMARTVGEAVFLADLHNPDLAVLDFRLANGEFGSQIRPLLKDKQTMGILYVSGDPLGEVLTNLDGDAYIQKPYGIDDLIRALRAVREIKLTGQPSGYRCPKGLHLLKDPSEPDRHVA
jgi:DNA-binding response OmpR family regulator